MGAGRVKGERRSWKLTRRRIIRTRSGKKEEEKNNMRKERQTEETDKWNSQHISKVRQKELQIHRLQVQNFVRKKKITNALGVLPR